MNQSLQEKIKQWYAANKNSFRINKHQGTWLHFLAPCIHYLARFTSLIALLGFLTKKYKTQPISLSEPLKTKLYAKLELYKQLLKQQQDQNGFIEVSFCDSLLYTSWVACVEDVACNISTAKDSEDYWHRRPTNNPCYPQGSGSTISRDMITGLTWYMWFKKDLKLAEQFLEHTQKNNFVMGLGDPSTLVLMPSLEATIAEIINKLGGKSKWFIKNQIQTWPTSLQDYQIKLAVGHALLRISIKGYATSSMLKMFKTYADQYPDSPLFTFANQLFVDGNMDQVANLLLDETLWPTTKLPTNHDRSEYWLVQRSNPLDYLPEFDKPVKTHSGGDFIFYAWLVKHAIENQW